MVIEIPIEIHGATSATREGSEGEAIVLCVVHGVSLQGQGWKSVEQRQCLRRHTVNGFVSIDPHPWDGVTCGESKNHHVFRGALGDLIGVGDADAVVCPMLIELAPGGGLDGETWCVVHDPIIGTGWKRSRSLV